MSGGSKTQTTTENQVRTPYAPAIPALQTIIDKGLAAYNSGVGSQVYQGDRTAGLGATTQGGLDYMKANAQAGLGTAQAGNAALNGLLANNGTTADTRSATQGLLGVGTVDPSGVRAAADRMGGPNSAAAMAGRTLTGGAYNLDASGYQGLETGLAGTSHTQRSLQDVADGKFLGQANPYTAQMIAQAQDAAADRVKRAASASGRYGSGMFQGAIADAVARPATELLYKDYDAERQRQAQAAQAIDTGLLSRTSARSGLLGQINDTRTANANQLIAGAGLASQADQAALTGQQALAGLLQANNQQRIGQYTTALSGAQSDRAAMLSGLGAVSGAQSNLLQPGRTLLGAGQAEDAARQLELAAAQDKFNEEQQEPWKQLGLLAELGLPVASAGGTVSGTTVQKVPQPSFLQQAFGMLLAGADTASKFYGK